MALDSAVPNQLNIGGGLNVGSGLVTNGQLIANSPITVYSGTAYNIATGINAVPSTGSLLTLSSFSTGLGSTAGNYLPMLSFAASNSNASLINIYKYRYTNGSSWSTASTRIQQTIDSDNQAYIEFNPPGNNYGIGIYSGQVGGNASKTLDARTTGITISGSGNVGIGNTNPGSLLSFGTPAGNNKILTLYDNAPTDSAATATNFLGFGINSGILRYQVPSGNGHVFYNGTNNAVQIGSTSILQANGSNTLGSTAGSSSEVLNIGNGSSSQFGRLSCWGYRSGNGSDWATTEIRIQKIVDVTSMQYIAFPGSTNVYISSLSKSAGTFDIEHPIDASGRLVHSFVEGPRCDLIYRGVTQLQGGKATVNIDTECVAEADCQMRQGTFVALCANPMCYLQNNVSFDRVRGTIAGNILTILCENANSTDLINWLVIAERKDKYIKEWTRTNENGFLKTEHDEM
jgi:hypothetical protein